VGNPTRRALGLRLPLAALAVVPEIGEREQLLNADAPWAIVSRHDDSNVGVKVQQHLAVSPAGGDHALSIVTDGCCDGVTLAVGLAISDGFCALN
jgi:hypothetical protein